MLVTLGWSRAADNLLELKSHASAAGVLAMADGMNVEDIARFFGEAGAVVANAKAKLAGLALELFHITFADLCKPMERGKDTHSGVPIQAANVGAGVLGPCDLPHA